MHSGFGRAFSAGIIPRGEYLFTSFLDLFRPAILLDPLEVCLAVPSPHRILSVGAIFKGEHHANMVLLVKGLNLGLLISLQ